MELATEDCDGDAAGRMGPTVTCAAGCTLKNWCNITPVVSAGQPGIGCIFPPAGSATGGTYATISGVGFSPGVAVRIGGVAATTIYESSTAITFFAPAGTANSWADVVVENTDGGSTTRTRAFAFVPAANYVTTNADAGSGSLRAALGAASTGGFVTFDRFLAGQEVALSSAISLNGSKTLVGLGADLSVLRANGTTRVVAVTGTGATELYGLTLTGGASSNGGGVLNQGTNLTINECAVVGNSSPSEGGGIYTHVGGSLTVLRSTVSGNRATGVGGGIRTVGASVATQATIINSTISGNSGADGGGIFNDIPLMVTSSTITANSAGQGGGIRSRSGVCTLYGSAVAGNTASSAGPDVNGTFASAGFNFIGLGGPAGFIASDMVGTTTPLAAMLGPLGITHGRTETHVPLLASPLINAGDPQSSLTEDQTRQRRPGASVVDIGSIELQ